MEDFELYIKEKEANVGIHIRKKLDTVEGIKYDIAWDLCGEYDISRNNFNEKELEAKNKLEKLGGSDFSVALAIDDEHNCCYGYYYMVQMLGETVLVSNM